LFGVTLHLSLGPNRDVLTLSETLVIQASSKRNQL
jgi:hypothetical protein